MKIGADTFIRVGTTGALVPHLDSGDIVVATGAVRWEGTSKTYIPTEYPAVASYQVVDALLQAADELGIKVHPGIIISSTPTTARTSQMLAADENDLNCCCHGSG